MAGKGVPFNAVAVNDPINFAISARNLDPTNSRAVQFLKADGTVLFQADASGVKVSPDGTVASVPVTATSTQTLTNKTFTSPHMTGPIVDSGGVTVTSGSISQTNAAAGTVDNLVLRAGGNLGSDTAGVELTNNSNTVTARVFSDALGSTLHIKAIGSLELSSGNAAFDSTGTVIRLSSTPGLGFYGASAAAKPTVTSAKGGNAALGSLMTALSTLGLVTDSTTA